MKVFPNLKENLMQTHSPQDPSFFNLQNIAKGTKHTLIQARVA